MNSRYKPNGKARSFLSLRRLRQKLWRENRPLMLSHAKAGLDRIAKARSEKAANLAASVSTMPPSMTPAELKAEVIRIGYRKDFASFIRRARKHGLLSFETASATWLNCSVKNM